MKNYVFTSFLLLLNRISFYRQFHQSLETIHHSCIESGLELMPLLIVLQVAFQSRMSRGRRYGLRGPMDAFTQQKTACAQLLTQEYQIMGDIVASLFLQLALSQEISCYF